MKSATRVIASTFGVLAGLPGIAYGYFEILQGNVPTNGIMIDAVGQANEMWHGGQAPALTIIPNYFATGILAVITSLIIILWAAAFIQRRNGGIILILLSIVQLLVGGGVAQIILAILVGALALGINAPLTWWRAHLSFNLRRFLASLWLWAFLASSILYFLHYAIPFINGITGSFFGVSDPNLGLMVGYSAIGPFILTIIAGFAFDSLRQPDSTQAKSISEPTVSPESA
jgi:hypothetical protein